MLLYSIQLFPRRHECTTLLDRLRMHEHDPSSRSTIATLLPIAERHDERTQYVRRGSAVTTPVCRSHAVKRGPKVGTTHFEGQAKQAGDRSRIRQTLELEREDSHTDPDAHARRPRAYLSLPVTGSLRDRPGEIARRTLSICRCIGPGETVAMAEGVDTVTWPARRAGDVCMIYVAVGDGGTGTTRSMRAGVGALSKAECCRIWMARPRSNHVQYVYRPSCAQL
ncbi:hypothetical protein PYCCODRAFT_166148 [Trametes coccinea BRFM310]|uniref:Uncharacterized protein n=1 Tax=Trametes coccinea (strain BRFM310) TaxID=1353009 RepID=A0A1Y2IS92_TRAC3|nr:hypothetical protein PYCCODRAFT_166148 [Trametes coccinea BRFM310]